VLDLEMTVSSVNGKSWLFFDQAILGWTRFESLILLFRLHVDGLLLAQSDHLVALVFNRDRVLSLGKVDTFTQENA